MAPRKKRAAKKTNRKVKVAQLPTPESEESLHVEKPKKVKTPAVITKPSVVTRQHKKFGKFRCLVEGSDTNLNKDESEDSQHDTEVFSQTENVIETINIQEVNDSSNENVIIEIESSDSIQEEEKLNEEEEPVISQPEAVIDVSEDSINAADSLLIKQDIISSDNEIETEKPEVKNEVKVTGDLENDETMNMESETIEVIEYPSNDMDSTEQNNIETETSEISQQLSHLNVNIVEINDNEEVLMDSSQEVSNTEATFNMESLSNDIEVIECVAEEIIEPLDETAVDSVVLEEINASSTEKTDNITKDEVVIEKDVTVNEEAVTIDKEAVIVNKELVIEMEKKDKKDEKSNKHSKSKSKNGHSSKSKSKKQEKKKGSKSKNNTDSNENVTSEAVRRSSRIKSISVLKKRSKGHGLVKTSSNKTLDSDTSENSNSGVIDLDKSSQDSSGFATPNSNSVSEQKPVKVKSRWRRSSELEMGSNSPCLSNRNSPQTIQEGPVLVSQSAQVSNTNNHDEEVDSRLKQFVHLKENQYLTERQSCKEAKKMICDCFLTPDEIQRGEYGCGEDCLNRLLMIECGNFCPVGDRCTNKRFQKSQFAPCEVFKTEKKGLGIRAKANIPYGEFILEYVGEVLDPDEFENRATEYSSDKNQHYYFMSLRADAVIDATQKGNISRFINHSCDPNAETQKWTVNGELRIGFYSKRTILAGEEITFDYQFQRYGKEAQKCFCESTICRGWLGEEPDDEDDEDEEDEEDLEDEKPEKIENKLDTEKAAVKVEHGETKKTVTEKHKKVQIKRERIRKKTRKEIFDDLDQLDREIESLITTGLKNQAQTLKLNRLMVRAKEVDQRIKLLKLLRDGEFPCRRLFLDYHGLRLIHGWMTDVDVSDKKFDLLRLEILQTLATLPIPNKTMLQDSKVLPTVEKWSVNDRANYVSVLDSDSNSPKPETDLAVAKSETESSKSETKLLKPETELLKPEIELSKTETESLKTEMESSTQEIKCEIESLKPEIEIPKSETPKLEIELSMPEIEPLILESSKEEIEPKSEVEYPKSETEIQLENTEKDVEITEKELALVEEDKQMDVVETIEIKPELTLEDKLAEIVEGTTVKLSIIEVPKEATTLIEEKKLKTADEIINRKPEINKEHDSLKKEIEEISNTTQEDMDISPIPFEEKEPEIKQDVQLVEEIKEVESNYEAEIITLALKLLEEWSVLKEVFRIPKKERIEQMKEHEREADRKYKAALDLEQDHVHEKKSEHRYRVIQRHRSIEKIDSLDRYKKGIKIEDRNFAHLPKLSKHERRKLFAMQVEYAEEERRRKQREMWRQHEQQCIMLGTDPRFTAPYDPNQGYHCVWNQQTGQWQNYPMPHPSAQANMYNSNIPTQHMTPYNYTNVMQSSITNLSPNLMHMQNMSPIPQQSQSLNHMSSHHLNQTNKLLAQQSSNQVPSQVLGQLPNLAPLPSLPYQETLTEKEDLTQVKFMGPIPPPVKLPPKWKCAKDKYGRPYYYHIKIRKSQWEPPELPSIEEDSETSSSSETSSLSSDTSSDDTDSDEDIDDSKLMQEIRKKFKQMDEQTAVQEKIIPEKKQPKKRKININDMIKDPNESNDEDDGENNDLINKQSSIDTRLKDLLKKDDKAEVANKRRRTGLVQEIIISPRTEEDRLQFKEDVKRYKENKAKLKRQKEIIMQQTKKHVKAKANIQKIAKRHKTTVKTKLKEMSVDVNSEAAKKIKETFRSNMAGVMVSILNAYRKPDCKEGRITNTEDFKHLARKLTHFVMLKEMKHCLKIDDLTCTDSVKSKAKEFVRKYMNKFGDVYQRPKDDLEYY